MGLSSKLVSSDGLDWSETLLQAQVLDPPKPPLSSRRQQQQNQPQPEPLKCPRCDSTNTKFCYYNNYNKSQPRHFCKTCKRHWTKGGTLRNVPVGGGRKNKRLKTSKTSSAEDHTATTSNVNTATASKINTQMAVQAQQQQQRKLNNFDHALGDNKRVSEALYQAFTGSASSVFQQKNGVFMSSATLPQLHHNSISHGLHFPYASSSTFDTNLCSIPTSFQSSKFYNYSGEAMEDSTITTIMPSTSNSMSQQPWQLPNARSDTDMVNYNWNLDDIENLISSTDLNIAWDNSEIKP